MLPAIKIIETISVEEIIKTINTSKDEDIISNKFLIILNIFLLKE
tara:strand:- start:103 stop:237 length:135 start_codon:yes stop_codon:yes gene_type:complete